MAETISDTIQNKCLFVTTQLSIIKGVPVKTLVMASIAPISFFLADDI
jgi:hypothetical protein